MATATVSTSATSRPVIFALLVVLATGACAATVAPTAPPQPTPTIIYVAATAAPAAPTPTPTPIPTATPTPTVAPTPEPTLEPVSYEPIVVKATTDKKTKPFYIGTYQATMTIAAKGDKSACEWALGAAYLFPVGEDVMYAGSIETETCGEVESTEVYLEPGSYYIETIIANVQITVTVTPHD